jgi:hypothetical protein
MTLIEGGLGVKQTVATPGVLETPAFPVDGNQKLILRDELIDPAQIVFVDALRTSDQKVAGFEIVTRDMGIFRGPVNQDGYSVKQWSLYSEMRGGYAHIQQSEDETQVWVDRIKGAREDSYPLLTTILKGKEGVLTVGQSGESQVRFNLGRVDLWGALLQNQGPLVEHPAEIYRNPNAAHPGPSSYGSEFRPKAVGIIEVV